MNKLSTLSLFSGIGGFDLGLERTGGFTTSAFCEIDPFCRKVLAKHWPEVPCYEDVTKLTGPAIAADGFAVDAIVGGFPCQDISIAGKGKGLAGERSGLWSEIARLTDEIQPKYLIVENSRVIRSRGLDAVLRDLAEIGYDAEWHCIPASSVGALHNRDRLWLVAYPQKVGPIWWGRLWKGASKKHEGLGGGELWQRRTKPRPVGILDGISDGVDRIGACGNAVVPDIPELIGRAILTSRKSKA